MFDSGQPAIKSNGTTIAIVPAILLSATWYYTHS
jgi:hypothetical protein